MGVPFRIVVWTATEAEAQAAANAAFTRLRHLDGLLSDYDPDSEVTRLCVRAGQGPQKVGDDLWRVLERAQGIAAASAGAFDITVGPLVELWRHARRTRRLPTPELLAAARARVGHQHLVLDRTARTADLRLPGMQLDLGGIAKGYAADEALAVLRKAGVPRALVAGEGDIVVGDPPPGTSGWRIAVAPLDAEATPNRHLVLSNAAVSTSGDAFQWVEIDGRRYAHVVDPRTGVGLGQRFSVTVVARDGMTADALATAIGVLGPERGLPLLAGFADSAALVEEERDGQAVVSESPGFRAFEVVPATTR
jgi:thiamine biosynthesis lipoprotein